MFVTVITGISGRERFLLDFTETAELKEAQRFKSEGEAAAAGERHIHAYPDCIARKMQARVVPLSRGAR